ncbi:MAG: MATE family efflux transporter [Acidimicrobiales bacterium]
MKKRLDPLSRRVVALAAPALGALIVEPLYNVTDSAIVGHLGKVPLGGLALATAALNVLAWTAAFLEMATVSVVAFRNSAGDKAGASRAIGAAYLLSGLIGVVTTGLIELAAPVIAGVLGGHSHGQVAADAIEYLRIAAVGMPVLFIALAGNGHLTGLANTKRPLLIALGSNVVNVVLEFALVYGAHLGIAGSAWGTVAAQVVAAATFVLSSRRMAVKPARPTWTEIRELVHDAIPLTVRTVALGAALLATTAIAARLGTTVLAGHQIAMQVWAMLALVLDSLAVPAQVYVSEALGARDLAAAGELGRRVLSMGLVLGVVLGMLTTVLSAVLPRIFSPDPAVQHQAMLALVVCGLQQPVAAGAFVLDGLILGASEYATLRRAMLFALLAFAPLALLTLAFHRIGILGIWFAMLSWLVARTVLLGRRWRALSTGPGSGPGSLAT